MTVALPLAHLAHWYSPIGFFLPLVLTILWLRRQSRRDAELRERTDGKAGRFSAPAVVDERWTIVPAEDGWRLAAVEAAAPGDAGEGASPRVLSPWSTALLAERRWEVPEAANGNGSANGNGASNGNGTSNGSAPH